jgi:hypothetical protein
MVVTFTANRKVTTLFVSAAKTWVDSYRLVGNVMIIPGVDSVTGKSCKF